jgi:hypothetical protein
VGCACYTKNNHLYALHPHYLEIDGTRRLLEFQEGDDVLVRADRFCERYNVGAEYKDILIKEMNKRLEINLAPAIPLASGDQQSIVQAQGGSTDFVASMSFSVPITINGQQLTLHIKANDKIREVAQQFCTQHEIQNSQLDQLVTAILNHRQGATKPISDGQRTQNEATDSQPKRHIFSLPVTVDGRKQELQIFEGDTDKFSARAEEFCRKYNLNIKHVPALVKVRIMLASYLFHQFVTGVASTPRSNGTSNQT